MRHDDASEILEDNLHIVAVRDDATNEIELFGFQTKTNARRFMDELNKMGVSYIFTHTGGNDGRNIQGNTERFHS